MSNDDSKATVKPTAPTTSQPQLPLSYAVHVHTDGHVEKQQQQPPLNAKPIDKKTAAEWAYERVALYIQKFEETLDSEHEVGIGLAGSNVGTLRIQGLGFFAPDIITFYGRDSLNNKMQLIQHVHQLNVMLVAERKISSDPKPFRMGFHLMAQLANDDSK